MTLETDPAFVRAEPGKCGWSLQICRGCCCGTQGKHPETNHAAHLDWLTESALQLGMRVRVVSCVGECSHSNVVTFRRHRQKRRVREGDTMWFGDLLSDAHVAGMCDWIRAGGPDAPVPGSLSKLMFTPRDVAVGDPPKWLEISVLRRRE